MKYSDETLWPGTLQQYFHELMSVCGKGDGLVIMIDNLEMNRSGITGKIRKES